MATPPSTPLYDSLVNKVRDWGNRRDTATVPDNVIEDCLEYSANDCYEKLRVPPLETTSTYIIREINNPADTNYSLIPIPGDLVEFIYLKKEGKTPIIYDEISDNRTFFNSYAEKYSMYHWTWKDDYLYLRPQLEVGDKIDIHYYRRLQALNALYDVSPINYVLGVSDANQPFLTLTGNTEDTPLFFSTSNGVQKVFQSLVQAQAWASSDTVTTKYYIGKEASNWIKESKEQLLMWGALHYLGSYLFDDTMETRYGKRFLDTIENTNKEEKKRRALGGNVRMNINSGGLI